MELAQYIEHTLLKIDATKQDLDNLLNEARTYNFKGVCVNGANVKYAKECLKDTNIKLISCGRGKCEEEIKAKIKELGIDDKVILLGYRKDINRIMQVSDIYFLPSHREGLCLSMIESMNFALPIVTSRVRGCQDLVEEGGNGFLEEKNDYIAYAKDIKKLATDKELYSAMSAKSKELAPTYSIENVKNQLEDIYNKL